MQEERNPQVRQLRKQMVNLLAQTRENEEKALSYRAQEGRFLALETLSSIVSAALNEYKQSFDIDAVTLVLDDPDYEIQRTLEDESVDLAGELRLKFLATQYQLRDAAKLPRASKLGSYDYTSQQWLFDYSDAMLQSVAEIPLMRGDRVIGALALGSRDPARFPEDAKSALLDSLAAVLAICLENALNQSRIKRADLTDPLTGVANRKYLDRRLEEETARCRRSGEPLSCLFIEADDFDGINQQHGRRVADNLLITLADVIGSQLRGSDTLARYEGASFAVLLVRSAPQDSKYVADRIREVIAGRSFEGPGSKAMAAHVSVGISALQADSKKNLPRNIADRMTQVAEEMLKQAQAAGGDSVVATVLN